MFGTANGSGKGLLKRKNYDDRKNRGIAYERILPWKTEGTYEVFGN